MLFAPLLCLALLPLLKGDLGPNMGNVTSAKPPTSSPSPVSFPLSSPEVLLATHTGREHMVEVPPVQKALAQTNGISSEVVKPVREESLLQETQQDGHKPVVPKKGVSFSDLRTNNTTANGTVTYKKPLITEADTDYISQEDSIENEIDVEEIDPSLLSSKSTRSKYIIPIVVVILSVPLVAILLSLLYKRGADWWQHRNYKRMDFLIEGIYQN
ncbi:uncharacterized protein LOC109532971 isoform X2 [Dendroctonus ponderosae]|uniref:uncharacterized protein LOC109532971 isoform X2 n=1 Tax=Dendroctonus ponderosae TaxID=77166 RepID=UPI002035EA08|nr:uncharacterized protein LOC109532971 isoform X2 [Dendroctonus ponderosae]KAH1027025.1 hypothetical protein HUJ05_000600 [Dendroctonus ponderosae]